MTTRVSDREREYSSSGGSWESIREVAAWDSRHAEEIVVKEERVGRRRSRSG